MVISKDVYFAFINNGSEVIVCYPELEVIDKQLFRFIDDGINFKDWSIVGTSKFENKSLEHWTVFSHSKFSQSLYLKIDGKIYIYFEDFFNHNTELCERVRAKLKNKRTVMMLEEVL